MFQSTQQAQSTYKRGNFELLQHWQDPRDVPEDDPGMDRSTEMVPVSMYLDVKGLQPSASPYPRWLGGSGYIIGVEASLWRLVWAIVSPSAEEVKILQSNCGFESPEVDKRVGAGS
ncbi:hypothetical protein BGZ95_000699 [Linnemannia exigua]|uniref:Uncharacterized protein n=1 Tax=Linnemannia exigua TaxID=604196 RepID=A0AAD4DJA9_9FUNG|nr:hypothetical protein BGZ95_000699 [Linnemannia exigua]